MRAPATLAASVAALASLGLHGAGLSVVTPTEPVTLAGGPAQLAMLGNSFEDAVAGMVTGTTDPEPVEASTETPPEQQPTPADTTAEAQTSSDTAPVPDPPQTAAAQPRVTGPVADLADQTVATGPSVTAPTIANVAPVVPPRPEAPTEARRVTEPIPVPRARPQDTPVNYRVVAAASTVAATSTAATPPAVAPTAPTAVSPPPTAAARADPDTITALADPVVQAPDAGTVRPQPRPDRSAVPQPQQQAQPAPQRRQQQPAPSRTQPQGNAAADSRAGQSSGQAQGTARQSAQGDRGQSASDGRTAARYPQLVNRHLSRLRRPNARFNGATVIAFTISGSGGLSGVSVARSSGNADFDRIAVGHVQRAAPFPPPPVGAQRSFNVTVQGR